VKDNVVKDNVVRFNPLAKKNLGASVAEALLSRKAYPLGSIPDFSGAGIYAVYYTGPFLAYSALSEKNTGGKLVVPIYVGKAVPAGARKGGIKGGASGKPLFARLKEHSESIIAATNLDIADFHCRFLVVDDIWIPLGESLLIAHFSPIWNNLIDGFGNHDPGGGRYKGMRPRWDILHPGRAWAAKCALRPETAEQIAMEVEVYLHSTSIPESQDIIELEE
jgi:hypothetical protein